VAKVIKADASIAVKTVEVVVSLSGIKRLRLRFWLGRLLLELAARVLPCQVTLDLPFSSKTGND